MITALNKHDRLVDSLHRFIRSQYDSTHTHLLIFSKKKRVKAEVDLIGIRGDKVDIFEVKCSYRISKARRQLKKIKKEFSLSQKYNRIRTFFYCGASRELKII